MKIIAFYKPAIIAIAPIGYDRKPDPDAPTINYAVNPGERIILSNDDTEQIQADPAAPIESITDFWPLYQHYARRPSNFRDKRILIYRPRGWGDQLISSALSRCLTELFKARCFQLCNRYHEMFWAANPYIHTRPVRFPLSIDSLIRAKGRPFYDWFFPMESVAEFDCEPEQGNSYDRQLAMCGLDPERIPSKYKQPFFGITEMDEEELGDLRDTPYIAFQLRATNISRQIPIHVLEMVLSVLDDIGMPILCLDDRELSPEIKRCISACKNAINYSGKTASNVRKYGTIICYAKLVVGPDSSAIHFAAVTERPCISLWSAFDPESRVRDYPNHIALFHPEYCQNAPCHNFLETLPYHKCPEGKEQKFCACFLGITPDEIRDAITKLGL